MKFYFKFFAFIILVMAVGELVASGEPGIIAINSQQLEVYVPDPILLVHGLGSSVNTFRNALPDIDGLFRMSDGSQKYSFHDANNGAGITYTPEKQYHVGLNDPLSDVYKSLTLHAPIAGFDYRARTGNGDLYANDQTEAQMNAPSIDQIALGHNSSTGRYNVDGFGNALLAKIFGDPTSNSNDNILNGLVPFGDEQASAVVVAHSMGGLVTRFWIKQALGGDPNGTKITPNNLKRVITLDTPHLGSGIGNCGTAIMNSISAIDAKALQLQDYDDAKAMAFRIAAHDQENYMMQLLTHVAQNNGLYPEAPQTKNLSYVGDGPITYYSYTFNTVIGSTTIPQQVTALQDTSNASNFINSTNLAGPDDYDGFFNVIGDGGGPNVASSLADLYIGAGVSGAWPGGLYFLLSHNSGSFLYAYSDITPVTGGLALPSFSYSFGSGFSGAGVDDVIQMVSGTSPLSSSDLSSGGDLIVSTQSQGAVTNDASQRLLVGDFHVDLPVA